MAKAKIPLEAPMMEGGDSDTPPDHEISHAADTLMRAEEIKNDPRLMPHVHKHMKKKMHSLQDLMKMAPMKKKEESEME